MSENTKYLEKYLEARDKIEQAKILLKEVRSYIVMKDSIFEEIDKSIDFANSQIGRKLYELKLDPKVLKKLSHE